MGRRRSFIPLLLVVLLASGPLACSDQPSEPTTAAPASPTPTPTATAPDARVTAAFDPSLGGGFFAFPWPSDARLLPGGNLTTRRTFAWIPREGPITAIVHRIEMQPFAGFSGRIIPYSRHQELHAALTEVVGGKIAAMEISAGDAVPYLDRIPWGVVDLLHSLGATVVSSADLVTHFAATWTAEETAEHAQAAELLRGIALEALGRALGKWLPPPGSSADAP